MRIEVIPQIKLGSIYHLRVGDFLSKSIADSFCKHFRFAVAYMRMSGLDRLGASIDVLLNRGGRVSGAIGIDDAVTSLEALEALSQISSDSTIFYTISGFIYHPKLYLMSGEKQAIAVVGSANLTRDGLFRNVELATAIYLDLEDNTDFEVYRKFDNFINELLNASYPNIQLVNAEMLQILAGADAIKSEVLTKEPGPPIQTKEKSIIPEGLKSLFPPLNVPVAPPTLKRVHTKAPALPSIVTPPYPVGATRTFIMQLSHFDSNHRTGTKGTTEALIPLAAVDFFPPTAYSGRKYPDVYFDAILNTNTGREVHGYRFWLYPNRTEFRLRLDHETIDLSTRGGGDLLVINKLPVAVDNDIFYEVTILPQTDPSYNAFLSQCTLIAQEKKWGIIES